MDFFFFFFFSFFFLRRSLTLSPGWSAVAQSWLTATSASWVWSDSPGKGELDFFKEHWSAVLFSGLHQQMIDSVYVDSFLLSLNFNSGQVKYSGFCHSHSPHFWNNLEVRFIPLKWWILLNYGVPHSTTNSTHCKGKDTVPSTYKKSLFWRADFVTLKCFLLLQVL